MVKEVAAALSCLKRKIITHNNNDKIKFSAPYGFVFIMTQSHRARSFYTS